MVGRGIDGGVGRGSWRRFFRAEDPPVRGVEPGAMRTRAGVVPPLAAPLAGVANVGGGSGLDPDPGVMRLPRAPMTAMPSSLSVSCPSGAVCVAASPPCASGGTTPARSRSASISSSATVLSRGIVAARGDAPRGDGLASSMRPAEPIPPRAPRVALPGPAQLSANRFETTTGRERLNNENTDSD